MLTASRPSGASVKVPEPDIEALLLAVASKDKDALQQIYRHHGGRLLAIATRMTGRRDLAEEAVQDTFVAVWKTAGAFDPAIGSARAWITTILRRRAIDRLRASPWLQREMVLPDVEERTAKDDACSLAVRQCMAGLPEPERRALTLVYLYGLTHAELSTFLEMPLGTVKSQVRRGLQAMRRCLEQ